MFDKKSDFSQNIFYLCPLKHEDFIHDNVIIRAIEMFDMIMLH